MLMTSSLTETLQEVQNDLTAWCSALESRGLRLIKLLQSEAWIYTCDENGSACYVLAIVRNMPRERMPPYPAAGFREDAEKLINRFSEKKSLKFVDFAEIWRDMEFSLAFTGRENLRELIEFTLECYRISILFMDINSEPYTKVGTVFLLYGLYCKQPLHILRKPVQIPVLFKQLCAILHLDKHFLAEISHHALSMKKAEEGWNPRRVGEVLCIQERVEDIMNFSFLITKLFKMGAFSVVAYPIPMGPALPISFYKLKPMRSSFFKGTLGLFRLLNEGEFKNIEEGMIHYKTLKKKLPYMQVPRDIQPLNSFQEMKNAITELEDRYNSGFLPYKTEDCTTEDGRRPLYRAPHSESESDGPDDLGRRRALLKVRQFRTQAQVGLSRRTRQSSDSSPEKSPVQVKRGRGRPKLKRTRGRRKQCALIQLNEFNTVDVQNDTDGENVDDPDDDDSVPRSQRKRKKPRPVRKHYFVDE